MKLSVIIIAKNEEEMIGECLGSVRQLTDGGDEIIVVDGGSEDKTGEVAKKMGAKVFEHKTDDFSEMRNYGLEKAKGNWILYVDADERVTPSLREEIKSGIRNPAFVNTSAGRQESGISAYKVKRKNFYFGNHEWPYIEKIERLFRKEALKGWQGKLHESPIIESLPSGRQGKVGELEGFLLHYTHRDLSSMVKKTLEWSKIEAELRFEEGHPKMTLWRFPRVMLSAFWGSYIQQGGWQVGTVGLIESLYQAFSLFITYARLWELQNKTKEEKIW